MADVESGLASGWEVRHSKSYNLPYYYNSSTGKSSWEPPEGSDAEKLKTYMRKHFSSVGGSAEASAKSGGGEKIRASHLLIKHKDSRNPSSWKESNITRTKEEAISILLAHEARIRSGAASLRDLALTESDCSSARRGGDLGYYGKGEMQKEFEDASFALNIGELSHVVETSSGVHLIERTA